jgi:hypothetical protein
MPLTRAQGGAALKHVVCTVIYQPDNGPLEKLLANAMIVNVGDLGSLIETDIENLTFAATEGENPIAIGPGQRGIIQAFIAYIRYRATQPSPIGDDWKNIAQEEFEAYRISPLFNGSIYGNPLSANPSGSAASSTNACDPIADFKRGIKRDPSQFPILKDEKQWDNDDDNDEDFTYLSCLLHDGSLLSVTSGRFCSFEDSPQLQ